MYQIRTTLELKSEVHGHSNHILYDEDYPDTSMIAKSLAQELMHRNLVYMHKDKWVEINTDLVEVHDRNDLIRIISSRPYKEPEVIDPLDPDIMDIVDKLGSVTIYDSTERSINLITEESAMYYKDTSCVFYYNGKIYQVRRDDGRRGLAIKCKEYDQPEVI